MNSTVPVQVTGLTGVVAIAGGLYHSLALKSDGTVWVWGYNGDGELGNGTNANSSVPSQLAGLTGVVAIASGGETSLALKSNGTVWAWGMNSFGELGNGSNSNSNVPVEVSGLTGAVAIAGGFYHSFAAVGGSVPALRVDPPSVSFTADGSETATISNQGAGSLRIGAITVGGLNPADFEISGTCSGASLDPHRKLHAHGNVWGFRCGQPQRRAAARGQRPWLPDPGPTQRNGHDTAAGCCAHHQCGSERLGFRWIFERLARFLGRDLWIEPGAGFAQLDRAPISAETMHRPRWMASG